MRICGNKKGRAVFLDRDGVLNVSYVVGGKPYAPTCFADFQLYNGIEGPLNSLKDVGYTLIVVTNQPDVGNDKTAKHEVERMHHYLMDTLPLEAVQVCYHSQLEGCDCRKPKPGMLEEAADRFQIELNESFMIGDRDGDIAAGVAAGCETILIDRGYCEPYVTTPSKTVSDVKEAVDYILDCR